MIVKELVNKLKEYPDAAMVVFGDDLGTCGEYSDKEIQEVEMAKIKWLDSMNIFRPTVIRLL